MTAARAPRVIAFAFLLAVVTYLDRICISAAAPAIMADLRLTFTEMGAIFSAFTLAYSLFEIPSGWLGDVIGPRRVLTRIVLWWSAFTMLTGAAQGFRSLVAIRFLFGAGEAGAFPNIARAFSEWIPAAERGRANGILFLGSRLGGMLSAPIALFLIAVAGWRTSFLLFGLLGVVWAAVWFSCYQDNVGLRAEGNGQTTPWGALLRSRNLYAICAMYFAFGYGLYFYFTWLPTYLIRVLGFSRFSTGLFAALPFLLAGIADVVGGWLTDAWTRRHGLRAGRCYLGFAAFLTCAAFLLESTFVSSPILKAILIAMALASADLALGACWAVPLDIAPGHAGVVTGFMNTLGNIGGLIGPMVVGIAVDRWGSWTFPFYITASIYAAGAVAWLAIDPTRPIAARAD